MERLDRASQFLDVCADFGKAGVDFGKTRVGLGLEFLEVRAERRRDILAGGIGNIGDRVGNGQGVEIELSPGRRPSPPIDGAVQRLVQALLVLTGGAVGGRRVITHWPQQFPACHVWQKNR